MRKEIMLKSKYVDKYLLYEINVFFFIIFLHIDRPTSLSLYIYLYIYIYIYIQDANSIIQKIWVSCYQKASAPLLYQRSWVEKYFFKARF